MDTAWHYNTFSESHKIFYLMGHCMYIKIATLLSLLYIYHFPMRVNRHYMSFNITNRTRATTRIGRRRTFHFIWNVIYTPTHIDDLYILYLEEGPFTSSDILRGITNIPNIDGLIFLSKYNSAHH